MFQRQKKDTELVTVLSCRQFFPPSGSSACCFEWSLGPGMALHHPIPTFGVLHTRASLCLIANSIAETKLCLESDTIKDLREMGGTCIIEKMKQLTVFPHVISIVSPSATVTEPSFCHISVSWYWRQRQLQRDNVLSTGIEQFHLGVILLSGGRDACAILIEQNPGLVSPGYLCFSATAGGSVSLLHCHALYSWRYQKKNSSNPSASGPKEKKKVYVPSSLQSPNF